MHIWHLTPFERPSKDCQARHSLLNLETTKRGLRPHWGAIFRGRVTVSFKSDAAAERFVSRADLTRYDLSGLKPVRFEFERNLHS